MVAHEDLNMEIVLQQLGELQHAVSVASTERNAMRDELRALKRYVAILVQADLERERSEMNVLVLQNPINVDALITQEGDRTRNENIFCEERTDP